MDENLVSSVLHGCKLASDVEQNLPMMATQPEVLRLSCEAIIRVFSDVREKLIASQQHLADAESSKAKSSNPTVEMKPSSSSQKQRKRPVEGYKIVKRVPAPQMGNLELPPEDGYTWRKYGQKEILGFTYPRSYYRCTHQKFYDCPAKKQVQRLEEDPFTFEVTYRDAHTCHVLSAGTSGVEAPPAVSFASPSLLIPTTAREWLSMQVLGGGGAGGSGGGFPEYGHLQVADMADAMFNSGSSSCNSMDHIFSSMDDKWDSNEEKKD